MHTLPPNPCAPISRNSPSDTVPPNGYCYYCGHNTCFPGQPCALCRAFSEITALTTELHTVRTELNSILRTGAPTLLAIGSMVHYIPRTRSITAEEPCCYTAFIMNFHHDLTSDALQLNVLAPANEIHLVNEIRYADFNGDRSTLSHAIHSFTWHRPHTVFNPELETPPPPPTPTPPTPPALLPSAPPRVTRPRHPAVPPPPRDDFRDDFSTPPPGGWLSQFTRADLNEF